MADIGTGMSGLAGRYASALLDLADEQKSLDTVAEDLGRVKAAFDESEDLRNLARSPLYNRDQQSSAVTAVMDRLGVGDLTRRFVLVATNNRRLASLDSMIGSYLAELARRRGEVTAQVTAARELNEAQIQSLTDTLRAEAGAKVQVEVSVDPALIGGLVVKIGSRMIDSSLRSKLQRLQLAMKGVG